MHPSRALLVLLALASWAGCSPGPATSGAAGTGPSSARPVSPSGASARATATRTLQVGRVTVYLCGSCIREARVAGADLPATVTRSIERIDGLLSLPTAYVDITDDPKATIPGIGTGGESLGQDVPVALDPRFRRFGTTVRVWVPLVLAHELDETKPFLDRRPARGTTRFPRLRSIGCGEERAASFTRSSISEPGFSVP